MSRFVRSATPLPVGLPSPPQRSHTPPFQRSRQSLRCLPDFPHGGTPETTERLTSLWTPSEGVIDAARRPPPSHGAPGLVAQIPRRPKTRNPPPDLASIMLDGRIVYIGMPLVPAVTELVLAEFMYLQYRDAERPIYLYINSSGTTRTDGQTVGLETEGTAIYDAMCFVKNEVYTVGVGMAFGQACMLLAAGKKGKRFMVHHSTAMLHQPRVPPTGPRQAIDVAIKWREVLSQKESMLRILSIHTGHSMAKLDKDLQRPLYMQPRDAIAYGVCDNVIVGRRRRRPPRKVPEEAGS